MNRLALLAVLAVLCVAGMAHAETPESEFALFKRTIAPVMKWGENGIITVPKALPVGKANLYIGANAQDAGKIEGDRIFLTTGTIMLGTSEDVEIGYSKRTFIWDNGDKTDLEMDTYHVKARIFHITDSVIPQLALGINAVSLKDNQFSKSQDILFNPYLAATMRLPLFTEKAVLSITGVAETIYNESESSKYFYSAGADLKLFNKLFIMAEMQGINKKHEDPIVNIGAKLKLGWFGIGAGMFNAFKKESSTGDYKFNNESKYWMAHMTFEIPFGDIFLKEKPAEKEKTQSEKPADKETPEKK